MAVCVCSGCHDQNKTKRYSTHLENIHEEIFQNNSVNYDGNIYKDCEK